jgi:hypothetical protein
LLQETDAGASVTVFLVIALENMARGLDVDQPHAIIVNDSPKEFDTVDGTASVIRLAHILPSVLGLRVNRMPPAGITPAGCWYDAGHSGD